MKGKLIVIEGTDCSGKETQVKKTVEKFKEKGINIYNYFFPMYDTPTGKIVGGPYLGKSYICSGWFKEGAGEVDPLTASAYYAADRRYNIGIINEHLNNGDIVILDRYVESNMAHQGGKLDSVEEREKMYQKLDELEFGIMELPRPDAVIFLYMPFEYAAILKQNREETPDEHEANRSHLEKAERAYLELTEKYNYIKVDCVKDDVIRTIDDINREVVEKIEEIIKWISKNTTMNYPKNLLLKVH